MIIRFLFIILTLVAPIHLVCQIVVKNDTSFKFESKETIIKIDSAFGLEENSDFELRFWALYSRSFSEQVFILTQKNNTWSARFFEHSFFSKDTLLEVALSQFDLPMLWQKLYAKNILNIPDEEELKGKINKALNGEPNSIIFDGTIYKFELITKQSKRSYTYKCPKNRSNKFKDIEEYKQVADVIQLIYTHCNLSKKDPC